MFAVSTVPEHARTPASTPLPGRFTPSNDPHDFLKTLFSFSCRKAIGGSGSPFLRELIVPFGGSGYVALFEIEDPRTVTILTSRHQREEDYH